MAVATSSSRRMLDFTMGLLDLKEFFKVIVTADDIKESKPDPEIYLKASKMLGDSPNDCVVFEDSFSGVESATGAGMKVILVMTSHKRDKFEKIDGAINDFSEISVKFLSSFG